MRRTREAAQEPDRRVCLVDPEGEFHDIRSRPATGPDAAERRLERHRLHQRPPPGRVISSSKKRADSEGRTCLPGFGALYRHDAPPPV